MSPGLTTHLCEAVARRRVLVVGDVMLDDYLEGETRRICPEAPVPVVELTGRRSVPGGAANAAANIAALGGRVSLGGVTGDDVAAHSLRQTCRAVGAEPTGFVVDAARRTTVKTRVVARGQQILRIDEEDGTPVSTSVAAALGAWAERMVHDCDAVLLSDYGKGVVRSVAGRVIDAARRAGKPIVVDPKGKDCSLYRGATVVKPNLGELGELVDGPVRDAAELREAGLRLAGRHPESAILVTRGAEGMLLFRAGAEPVPIDPVPALRVFDVTGAGDTAAAALTLGLAAGFALEDSARVAAVAAAIVVGKPGTAVVDPGELAGRLAAIADWNQRSTTR